MPIYLDGDDVMAQSLCFSCIHKVSRIIVPLDYESFGINDEMLEELGKGEDLLLEHHLCGKFNAELDYLVLDCPAYTNTNGNLMASEEFRNLFDSSKIRKPD